LAIAEALMVHRTLNAEQIDNVISSAPEFARRVYCARKRGGLPRWIGTLTAV
jgi:hypothetical protein